jgi:hypothetical protein
MPERKTEIEWHLRFLKRHGQLNAEAGKPDTKDTATFHSELPSVEDQLMDFINSRRKKNV